MTDADVQSESSFEDDELGSDVNGSASDDSKRPRSTIRFPYSDLAEVERIATAVKNSFGRSAMIDQVAGALNQKSSSGAFRVKLTAAHMFGVLTTSKGRVTLTELGSRLADPQTQDEARVDAFMRVPLYGRLYAVYQGQSLPKDSGLEAEIKELGVVPSQSERARQVFLRSAEQAGLFWAGRDRLVQPPNRPSAAETPAEAEAPAVEKPKVDSRQAGLDPLLARLFERMLPSDGEPFPAAARQLFFSALRVNLDVIYGPTDEPLDSRRD